VAVVTIAARSGAPPSPEPTEDRGASASARDSAIVALLRRRRPAEPVGWLYLLVVVLIVFQRFVVPGTVVSIALPVAFLVVGMLCIRGHIVADRTSTVLYAAAVGACCTASLVASWTGLKLSLSSLALLAVIYVPCCFRLSPGLRRRFPDVLALFQSLMLIAAAVCVGQWVAQMAGWQFEDLLGGLPPQMLASTTEFNLSYPLYYGSSIYKSNGVVFLEPSFASQFLAIAIIVHIVIGGPRWRLVLLGAGLLATFSGTGIMLLAAGLAVLLVRRGTRWAARAAIGVVVAVVVVAVTPAGSLLAARTDETSSTGSSANARFVAPYEQVFAAVSTDLPALLVGRGAGSVTRDVEFFNPLGVYANYPTAPKLLGEYGLPATIIFLVFLLRLFLRRVPSITLGLTACMLYFVLSAALLQPPIIYTAWLLTGLFATGPTAHAVPRRGPRPPPPHTTTRPTPLRPSDGLED
jgi:hypothetical protein